MVIDAAASAVVVAAAYGAWLTFRFIRAPRGFTAPEVSSRALITAALLVAVLLLTASWSSTGRSPGGRLMGLRVLDRHDRPPHFFRSLLRALTCVTFPLGLFWSAVSKRNASIHDLVFSTSVVYDWRTRTPGSEARA